MSVQGWLAAVIVALVYAVGIAVGALGLPFGYFAGSVLALGSALVSGFAVSEALRR